MTTLAIFLLLGGWLLFYSSLKNVSAIDQLKQVFRGGK